VRDKGLMWVTNQAMRIGVHKLMHESCSRIVRQGTAEVLLIEPESTDGILFMHNPASFAARRAILEYAYRTTRARVSRWFEGGERALKSAGWQMRSLSAPAPE
jgi:hypothetical protein